MPRPIWSTAPRQNESCYWELQVWSTTSSYSRPKNLGLGKKNGDKVETKEKSLSTSPLNKRDKGWNKGYFFIVSGKEALGEKEIDVNSWAQSYRSSLGSWVLRGAGSSARPLDSSRGCTRRWLWLAGLSKRKEKQDSGSCADEFLTSPSTAPITWSSNRALFSFFLSCLPSF